jgi:hypothetical protein
MNPFPSNYERIMSMASLMTNLPPLLELAGFLGYVPAMVQRHTLCAFFAFVAVRHCISTRGVYPFLGTALTRY